MAHESSNDAFIDRLLAHSNDEPYKNKVYKILRQNKYPSTNQFDIRASFDGLIEKYCVFGFDAVAERLSACLSELNVHEAPWICDVLALLLKLSDGPGTVKVNDDRNQDLNNEVSSVTSESDILGDDAFARSWRPDDGDIESEDETVSSNVTTEYSYDAEGKARKTGEDITILANSDAESVEIIIPSLNNNLAEIQNQQIWRNVSQMVRITDLELFRELCNILRGLPSVLASFDVHSGVLEVSPTYISSHLSSTAFQSFLFRFIELGNHSITIRNFLSEAQDFQILQAFQAGTEQIINAFDKEINASEQRMVFAQGVTVVSLLELSKEMRRFEKQLKELHRVILGLRSSVRSEPWLIVDILKDVISQAQATGDISCMRMWCELFCRSFEGYLKPLSLWMTKGRLDSYRPEEFPVVQSKVNDTLQFESYWRDSFHLRRNVDGALCMPSFVQQFASSILASGKAAALLAEINRSESTKCMEFTATQPSNTPAALQSKDKGILFSEAMYSLPYIGTAFELRLNQWFDMYIKRKTKESSLELRNSIVDRYSLVNVLKTLQIIYFSTNVELFLDDATATRETPQAHSDFYIASRKPGNKCSLENIRMSLAERAGIDLRAISIEVPASGGNKTKSRNIATFLDSVKMAFQVPSVLCSVIKPSETISIYNSIAIFILKIDFGLKQLHRISQTIPRSITPAAMILTIQHRILHIFSTIRWYISYSVISPASKSLFSNIEKATDLDMLIDAHDEFLLSLQSKCFLDQNADATRDLIYRLLELGADFVDLFDRLPCVDDLPVQEATDLVKLNGQINETLTSLASNIKDISASNVEAESTLSHLYSQVR